MSEQGAFWVDRGIWDHPVLKSSRPFSKLEAWLWLISEAAWKPHRTMIAGREFILQRGQLAHSLRFIAQAWRWHRNRVCHFLDTLKTGTMIGTDVKHGLTVITISKYEEYQRRSSAPDHENGTPNGTRSGQHRDKPNKKDSSLNREESFRKKGKNARARVCSPFDLNFEEKSKTNGRKPRDWKERDYDQHAALAELDAGIEADLQRRCSEAECEYPLQNGKDARHG